MAGATLGWREAKRAPVRFGLLSLAVGVLVFLIVFQQALLGALVGQFVGAIERQSATVLVYGDDARRNLQGSVVDPALVEEVAAVEGVAVAAPLGVATVTVELTEGEQVDAAVLGAPAGGPGTPEGLADGRQAEAEGEVVASPTSDVGLAVGDELVLVPGDVALTVVGLVDDAQLSVTTSLFTTDATYEALRRAANPGATEVPPSAVAVAVDDGADPAEVAERISAEVDAVDAVDRETAAADAPGVASVDQSFTLVLGLTFLVVGLVVGFFFLILTVQKRGALTLLRALGAPARGLVAALLVQVLLVVGAGIVVGTLLAAALLTVAPLGATLSPGTVATTAVALLAFSVVASTAAVRRVLRIDPVEATVPGGSR